MNVIPANELENHIGEEIGVSDWIEITHAAHKHNQQPPPRIYAANAVLYVSFGCWRSQIPHPLLFTRVP